MIFPHHDSPTDSPEMREWNRKHFRLGLVLFIIVIIFGFLGLICKANAQDGGQANAAGSWEPRNLATKAGLVAYYDPGNKSTLASNPAGAAAGSGVSWLSNRVETASTNTHLVQGTAANQPVLSRTDNAGNLAKYSDDITQISWTATDATKTGPGELTFTAQNGKLIQNIPTASGLSYTFSFYARTNVPGNVNLTILHTDSATGNSTAQTITGVLAPYSVTVLGKAGAGGNVSFGIQDGNASGFGSILFTNMQVRVSTWDSTYIATTSARIFPGLNGRSVMYFDGLAYYLKSAAFTLNQPEEVYLGINQWTWMVDDTFIDGITGNNMLIYQHPSSNAIRQYAGSNGATNLDLTIGAWNTVTALFSSTNSALAVGNGTRLSTSVGTANAGGITLGTRGNGAINYANMLISSVLICAQTNSLPESSYLVWGLKKQVGIF